MASQKSNNQQQGGNLVWYDTKGNPQIEGLFQSYTIKNYSDQFADWLLGLTNNATYDKRFGKSIPKINAANLLNSNIAINNKDYKLLDDKDNSKMLEKLENLLASIDEQTKQLYKDLGCGDFEGFTKLWYGKSNIDGRSSEKSRRNYWINKHLNLFTGETQRIGIGKGFTDIEQILELVGMIMQANGFEGFSSKEKNQLKKILEGVNIIELTPNEILTRWGPRRVFILAEALRKNRTGTGEEELGNQLKLFFENNASEHINKEAVEVLEDCISTVLGDKKKKNTQANKTKTIDSMFVRMDFQKASKEADPIGGIVKILIDFLKRARIIAFSQEEYEDWENYERDHPDMLEKALRELCNDFFKTDYEKKLASSVGADSDKMGFLGELYTHGKTFFNLKEFSGKKVDVYSTGNLKDIRTGDKLGQDTILTVKGRNYGIQTKNPYQTENGFYHTYSSTYKLDSKELYNLYLRFPNSDMELLFKQININLSNTTKPDYLKTMIEEFLFVFTDNFLRFSFQKTGELQGLSNDINDQLQKGSQNVFFVVRGYLIESRSMIEELIEQFKNFREMIQDKKKIWGMTYTNNITPNSYSVEGATPTTPIKYDPSKIVTTNLLSQITIHTAMNIRVKPIQEQNLKRIKI